MFVGPEDEFAARLCVCVGSFRVPQLHTVLQLSCRLVSINKTFLHLLVNAMSLSPPVHSQTQSPSQLLLNLQVPLGKAEKSKASSISPARSPGYHATVTPNKSNPCELFFSLGGDLGLHLFASLPRKASARPSYPDSVDVKTPGLAPTHGRCCPTG